MTMQHEPAATSDLLDVSELSLRDLDELKGQETPLGQALRRILDDPDATQVAGFTSFI